MNSRPFRVLIVANDRKLLRRLSRFLKVFGFQVEPVADGRQARTAYEANPPDFLIVDGDCPAIQQCRQLFSENRNGYTYTFLMIRDAEMEGLTEALEAGVDDFLAKPLVYGELLARLRSGARVLEYERRMREQSAVDHVTTLLSRSAFRDRLQSEMDRAENQTVGCVTIDLDFFANINRVHGYGVGDEVLRVVADHLKSVSNECKYLSSFGSGRFTAALPDATDAKALAWAETVRETIEGLDIPVGNTNISLTASLGVSSTMNGPATADDLIHRAEEAARSAKASGRNCVARCGQFDSETREWEDLARQGRLFENTVARDVMVPCTLFAPADQDIHYAAELLEQTQLNEIPVVDRQGRLVGLFGEEQVAQKSGRASGWRRQVNDVMTSEVPTVAEDTNFGELMNLFMDDSKSNRVVVVVRHEKPLGLVYRSGLAALSEPLTTDSFAPDQPYSTSSDYLLVPDSWSAL